MSALLMPTNYDQLPIYFERGKGVWLYDSHQHAYLDALSGLGVNCLGHGHPDFISTITDQINKLIHTSNTYRIDSQDKLAEKLLQISQMEQAVFVNSGAEANETAIKLTRLYAKKNHVAEPIILSAHHAFHGHTMAATSASGIERVRIGFEPLLPTFIQAPFNNVEILTKLVAANPNIVAIMLEPIQGDGGIKIPEIDYLPEVRKLCDKHNLLLILDEVQTGIARTGKWFAFQHYNIIPDILTVAKALGNGIPIGACLVRGKARDLFEPGKHGSTFGGSPLACTASLAVLSIIENDNIIDNIVLRGQQILDGLKNRLPSFQVRGKGLMIGVDVNKSCQGLMHIGLENKILFNIVSEHVIRLLPPFIVSEYEANEIVERLSHSIMAMG